jgi:hypothetical protein
MGNGAPERATLDLSNEGMLVILLVGLIAGWLADERECSADESCGTPAGAIGSGLAEIPQGQIQRLHSHFRRDVPEDLIC